MATKGPSFRYGNTNGSKGSGEATKHTNFAWAKDFNKSSLEKHFSDHGSDFNSNNKEDYKSSAIRFANTVDRKNNISFVNKSGTTYKYNKNTNTLCLIDKNGYIITYYKPKGGRQYYEKVKRENKK